MTIRPPTILNLIEQDHQVLEEVWANDYSHLFALTGESECSSKKMVQPLTKYSKYSRFERLPTDITELIIRHLSLRSISSLSLASRSCLEFCRSESIWRWICRDLVSDWIHRSFLTPPLFPSSDHHRKESSDPDWTLGFEPRWIRCDQHHPAEFGSEDWQMNHPSDTFNSWYQFAARFLLPNLHYLGWHVSDRPSYGRLILVTFDPTKCEFVGREVISINLFDNSYYNNPNCVRPPYLPNVRPSHPAHAFNLSRRMEAYRIDHNAHSPYAGYDIDLFRPANLCVHYFQIRPNTDPSFSSDPFFPRRSTWSTHQSKYSVISTPNSIPTFPSSDTLRAIRRPDRALDTDLINLGYQSETPMITCPEITLTSFKLEWNPLKSPFRFSPTHPNPRIRWQSPPNPPISNSVNIIRDGRRFELVTTGPTWSLRFDMYQERYFPVIGPSTRSIQHQSSNRGLEGLWIGYYGHNHGSEFGHLTLSGKGDVQELSFVKATGDTNVPSGIVSWRTWINVGENVSVRQGWIDRLERGDIREEDWDIGRLKGQGRVANENYEHPRWIDTWITLIEDGEGEDQDMVKEYHWDGGHVHSIRVVWTELNHVSTFYRVRFE